MKSYVLNALAVIACLSISQTALARQVAVCYQSSSGAYPTESIDCYIGNADTWKTTTLFELTKAGWSIQAVTPLQWSDGSVSTYFYLEKP